MKVRALEAKVSKSMSSFLALEMRAWMTRAGTSWRRGQVADHVAGEADGVGLVVDREVALVAEAGGVAAQDADAGGVERRDPHAAGDRADERLDPLTHLAGRLVGERDGEDLEWRYALLGDQPGDPVGEDPGLARAGAGHDEEGAGGMGDGFGLAGLRPARRSAVGRRREGWGGSVASSAAVGVAGAGVAQRGPSGAVGVGGGGSGGAASGSALGARPAPGPGCTSTEESAEKSNVIARSRLSGGSDAAAAQGSTGGAGPVSRRHFGVSVQKRALRGAGMRRETISAQKPAGGAPRVRGAPRRTLRRRRFLGAILGSRCKNVPSGAPECAEKRFPARNAGPSPRAARATPEQAEHPRATPDRAAPDSPGAGRPSRRPPPVATARPSTPFGHAPPPSGKVRRVEPDRKDTHVSGICDGRIVIVTGGGRGIGREHALEFARQGAKVLVNDLGAEVDGTGTSVGPAGEVVDAIRAMGGEAIANGEDVSDLEGATPDDRRRDRGVRRARRGRQ